MIFSSLKILVSCEFVIILIMMVLEEDDGEVVWRVLGVCGFLYVEWVYFFFKYFFGLRYVGEGREVCCFGWTLGRVGFV